MLFDRLSSGFGPTETPRLLANRLVVPLERTIVYTYDNLYRLTGAGYSTGELYEYDYDPVGNRLEQIINGDTTTYTYDDANRLEQATHQSTIVSYQFDDNGNLLKTGVLTNAFDAANRLTSTVRAEISPILPQYNGIGDRVAQTVDETTVYYVLDVVGLPEVIQTSEGNSYLHLPGVIMAENSTGEVRYLLSDGLGSIRQAVDETAEVVSSDEFDPYGNPLTFHVSRFTPYGYTGEWWQEEAGLLHLRARWYLAETGTFVSRDAWLGNISRPDTLHGYSYASNNPIINRDPSGLDYIPWLDRYTCDDPRAHGGYVSQYDQATGTWGLWPCIVDPNNVTTQGPPSLPSSPPLSSVPPPPPGPPTSTVKPDCDPGKPCRVILGANKLANVSKVVAERFTNLRGAVPYHSYLLVVDPNSKQRDGFPSPQPSSLNVPGYINVDERATVYYFGAFSERALTLPAPDPTFITIFNAIVGVDESYFGKLVVRYGLYNLDAPDYIAPDKSYLTPQWAILSKNSNCDDILKCFKRTFDLVESLEFAYGAGVINSNRVVSTALLNCGLPATHPANNVFAPGWYNPD